MMNIDMVRFRMVVLNSFEAAAAVGLVLLVIVLIHRRVRTASTDVPYACQLASAMAVFIGVVMVASGVGHSVAVTSMALKASDEYGPLVILRFTTGALLVYSGAMNIALGRSIRAGRRWAIAVGIATSLFFCVYLVFTIPLPDTGTSVASALGVWMVHLLCLCAAAFASWREDHGALPSVRPAA